MVGEGAAHGEGVEDAPAGGGGAPLGSTAPGSFAVWRLLRALIRLSGRWAIRGAQSPARLPGLIKSDLRELRDVRRLSRSGLFDPAWYLATYRDVGDADPARHFLAHGAAERRRPNPLFDTRWYLERYPDVARLGQNPLLHYLLSGAAEGRDPNPYFSSQWYLTAYADVAGSRANPLAHYLAGGGLEGRRPSARFDAKWYLAINPSVATAGLNPLVHFLEVGRKQGLAPNPNELHTLPGEPVERTRISVLKPVGELDGREIALFVAHSPDGRLKPHVAHHVAALGREGLAVVLIVAADAPFAAEAAPLDHLAGLYVRDNEGYDFAAWAHLLKLELKLFDAPLLLLVNDSIVGPVSQAALGETLKRARASEADVVGLTDSEERSWHLQSYFLCLKAPALRNPLLQTFWLRVRILENKEAVIDSYEVRLAAEAIRAGLDCAAVFRANNPVNATLFDWRGLLDEGFPYIKGALLSGRHPEVDVTGWREAMAAKGFDPTVLDAPAEPPAAASSPRAATPTSGARPIGIAFHGPWNYANSLGAAGRGYISALWRLDRPLNLHPIKVPLHIHGRATPSCDVTDFAGPADVAIVHLNPDSWFMLTEEDRTEIDRARVRVGLWVWEMDHIPDFFERNLHAVDVIWAPSRFCVDVFRAGSNLPVHLVPHVVPVPPEQACAPPPDEALEALGIPAARRIILYVFDGASYVVRKNPGALVEAFVRSGLHASGWTLVLKAKNLMDAPGPGQALVAQAQAAAGVVLIDRPLSREEMADLFAAADIYASPHASEGFGLTIAEAMAAGKTVVATDYGGSRDFVDASCGFPVAAQVVTLDQDHGHYRAGGRWAQVDVAAMALALQEAAARIERGDRSIAERARARIAEDFSIEAVAAAMRRSLAEIAAMDVKPRERLA